MPRQARIDATGALHHIICRGIERKKIFSDDTDRDAFISRLGTILTETSTQCYAWSLIPNHFHLLLRTGAVPVATVMRRLLTGYAIWFNRRHARHGHLFQNRYKSILCQEEPYMLELIRYIHLNPLRAGVVKSPEELKSYPYCGHGRILRPSGCSWQEVDDVLAHFDKRAEAAREAYAEFVAEGVAQGKREDLIGGGLFRSAGGWGAVISARAAGTFLKSDERILGDSDFVDSILSTAEEGMERRARYRHLQVNMERLAEIVAETLAVDPVDVGAPGKQPPQVQARSLFCFWAVRELGATATELARRLGVTQPAVTYAVKRGERLVAERGWSLERLLIGPTGRNL